MRLLVVVLALLLSTFSAAAAFRIPVIVSPALLAPIRIFPAKVVASGGHVILWVATALNPDCSSNGPVTFKVVKSPTHGKMSIRSARVFPSYPPNNLRSVCNTRRVAGQQVNYVSRNGFTGVDLVEFEIFYPAGQGTITRIPIIVR